MRPRGFTLVETLFTLMIVITLMTITIPYLSNKSLISLDIQINDILSLVDFARMEAIATKEKSEVIFLQNSVCFNDTCLYLTKGNTIKTNTILSFNTYGNLGQGKTIKICNNACREIIFNVGSGASYEKK